MEDLGLYDLPQAVQRFVQISARGDDRKKRSSYVGSGPLPRAAQNDGCRRLEWTLVRRRASDNNDDVDQGSDHGENDKDGSNRMVDGPHVFVEPECEKEEGNLEHYCEALDEEMETPLLESIAFALTVSATFDHRPACIP